MYGRHGSRPFDECPFPVSLETLVNTLVEFAEVKGFKIVSQALRTRGVKISLEDYDGWDGGIWRWSIDILLSPKDWASYNQGERSVIANTLSELVDNCFKYYEHNFTVYLRVIPASSKLKITNQGRAHSANPASIEYEGFLFRSQPEKFLFIALRDTGIPVMPLPVVASTKTRFKRIEPDFVLIRKGMTFVVEVDGDIWHKETPAEAQQRLSHLEDEGVRVIRVSAENCKSTDSAKDAANKILSKIERMLESR